MTAQLLEIGSVRHNDLPPNSMPDKNSHRALSIARERALVLALKISAMPSNRRLCPGENQGRAGEDIKYRTLSMAGLFIDLCVRLVANVGAFPDFRNCDAFDGVDSRGWRNSLKCHKTGHSLGLNKYQTTRLAISSDSKQHFQALFEPPVRRCALTPTKVPSTRTATPRRCRTTSATTFSNTPCCRSDASRANFGRCEETQRGFMSHINRLYQ